jgi:DivIVA domain-containing protein
VPLDRQDIERRDFPVTRRGYDPEEVDAHLRRLADEMERLGRSPRAPGTMASTSSEQVRAIVAAAEATAAQITRQAEEEADRARREANARAGEPLGRLSDAARSMFERLDAVEHEVADLLQGVRSRAGRLAAELDALKAGAAELRAPGQAGEPEVAPPVVEEFADEVEGEEPPEAAPAVASEPEPAAAVADDAADAEGARLIALNMALSGTPRSQADRYLAENFDLDDRQRLLDDVYSRVG